MDRVMALSPADLAGPQVLADARSPHGHFGRAVPPRREVPPTAQGRDTRDRIRKEAARLFASFGVGAVGMPRVAAAARIGTTEVSRHYAGRGDLLADVLDYHVAGLTDRVCAAFDANAAGLPRLEAVVRAWLDHLAAEPSEHRAFLISIHLLPAEWRTGLLDRVRFLLETVIEALTESVSGLAARPEAKMPLVKTARALLCDPSVWPTPPGTEEHGRDTRRIAGILLATARAELARGWPALGPTEGPPVEVESADARARLKELLDIVKAGQQVLITRRGRPEARLVPAI